MKVILSIKPEYADKIFAGSKKYEFRRAIFKNPDIKTILVYSSSPVQKIIGEFEIEAIISDDLVTLWQKTKKYSGISEKYFFDYFGDKEKGFAIQIKKTKKYKNPKCRKEDFNRYPPQSFVYYA